MLWISQIVNFRTVNDINKWQIANVPFSMRTRMDWNKSNNNKKNVEFPLDFVYWIRSI